MVGSSASNVGKTTATLSAGVVPGFRDTTYHFEYGRTSTYGSRTPESASIGSDNTARPAAATLTGLVSETTYHYRVLATNAIGGATGPDQPHGLGAAPRLAADDALQEGLRQAQRRVRQIPPPPQSQAPREESPVNAAMHARSSQMKKRRELYRRSFSRCARYRVSPHSAGACEFRLHPHGLLWRRQLHPRKSLSALKPHRHRRRQLRRKLRS